MAASRKRKKIRSGPPSPSTPLIVFLVFFIVVSLGLGIWAFSIQKRIDERDNEIKKLADAAKKDDLLTKWYRLQALWAKSVTGALDANETKDLTTYMGQYRENFFKDKDLPDYTAFQQMVDRDLEKLGGKKDEKTKAYENWDDTNKRLKTNYREQWDALNRKNSELEDKFHSITRSMQALAKNEKDRKDQEGKDWKTLIDEIVATNSKVESLKVQYEKEVKKVIAELLDAGKGMESTVEKIRKDYNTLSAEQRQKLQEKDQEIAKQQATLSRYEEQAKKVKVAEADVLARDRPKGKIVRVDFTGKMPYINVGSADGAREELTFSIFGRSASGQIDKEPKGNLEIARVIGPHLSQARILSLRDASFSPIQEGDVVFNPAWDPNRKTHVAIAGIVDFSETESSTLADQMRGLREFMNNLERQNVVIDAYLDLRDQKVKGPGLSLNTEYLILAASPSYGGIRILDTKDEKVNIKSRIEDQIKAMRDDAVKKGVAVIPLHKFAVLTGYRVPRAVRGSESLSGGGYEERQPAREDKPQMKKKEEPRLGEKKEDKDDEDMKKKDKDDEDMKKKDKKDENS